MFADRTADPILATPLWVMVRFRTTEISKESRIVATSLYSALCNKNVLHTLLLLLGFGLGSVLWLGFRVRVRDR